MCLSVTLLSAQTELKVHISADLEGVAGSVTKEQTGQGGFEYQQAREWMTREVLSAIEGARAAGATEILVADSHGNGQNLLLDMMPAGVQVVRSWPRPLGMMEGVDESFDAALFIGYHTSSSSTAGLFAHTYTGSFTDVRINGTAVTEAALNAAIAGHFGVPAVMISGDDAAVEEARSVLGDLEGAVVKHSYGFNAARTLTPEDARSLIREKAKRGVERRDVLRPYVVEKPVTLDLTLQRHLSSELLSYLPSVERTGSHSVRFIGEDMIVVSKFLEFAAAALSGIRQ
jgi:D-amino peptidase